MGSLSDFKVVAEQVDETISTGRVTIEPGTDIAKFASRLTDDNGKPVMGGFRCSEIRLIEVTHIRQLPKEQTDAGVDARQVSPEDPRRMSNLEFTWVFLNDELGFFSEDGEFQLIDLYTEPSFAQWASARKSGFTQQMRARAQVVDVLQDQLVARNWSQPIVGTSGDGLRVSETGVRHETWRLAAPAPAHLSDWGDLVEARSESGIPCTSLELLSATRDLEENFTDLLEMALRTATMIVEAQGSEDEAVRRSAWRLSAALTGIRPYSATVNGVEQPRRAPCRPSSPRMRLEGFDGTLNFWDRQARDDQPANTAEVEPF